MGSPVKRYRRRTAASPPQGRAVAGLCGSWARHECASTFAVAESPFAAITLPFHSVKHDAAGVFKPAAGDLSSPAVCLADCPLDGPTCQVLRRQLAPRAQGRCARVAWATLRWLVSGGACLATTTGLASGWCGGSYGPHWSPMLHM